MACGWMIICVFFSPYSPIVGGLGLKPFVISPPLICNRGFFRFFKNHLYCLFICITRFTMYVSLTEIGIIYFIPCISFIHFIYPLFILFTCESLNKFVIGIYILMIPMLGSLEIYVIFVIIYVSYFASPLTVCFLMIC